MGKVSICAIVAGLLTASTASADVQVLLNNGRVSIVAKDATVRQILSEWARVGQTKIVNVERIPGGPLTLELRNVPEGEALDVLLRSVSGYMAAPRQTAVANLSVFDRILVMPTAAAPRAAAAAQPAPAFQQPQFQQPLAPVDNDADDPPANVQVPNQPRGPVFNAFPPPQVGGQNPGAQPAAPVTFGAAPSVPAGGGVSVPGMMTQPQPPQTGMPTTTMPGTTTTQPGQPTAQPGQTTRPGGRGGGQQ
jgi:hypothetical protein